MNGGFGAWVGGFAGSLWVDPRDWVWRTDWSANAIVRFDPVTEAFTSYLSEGGPANVRQMLGRAGEAQGRSLGSTGS